MITTRDISLSVQTVLGFEQTLALVRSLLEREGFRVALELPFHRELVRHLGLHWSSYTVLLVWSPFHAYQGLLTDRDAGLLLPFNVAVLEDGKITTVAVVDHGLFGRTVGSFGMQVLVRELSRKLRQILFELAIRARVSLAKSSGDGKEAR